VCLGWRGPARSVGQSLGRETGQAAQGEQPPAAGTAANAVVNADERVSRAPSTSAATAVSAMEAVTHAVPSTCRRTAVVNPKTGTAIASFA
jgi:hypothetical protein